MLCPLAVYGPIPAIRRATLQILQPLKLFAASFAKISQRIHRAAVHHVPQFGQTLIWRQIGVHDHSSNFVRVLNNRRR